MESPYNGKNVNGGGIKPKAWYCDECGGYFTIDDMGYADDEYQVCRECTDRNTVTERGKNDNKLAITN